VQNDEQDVAVDVLGRAVERGLVHPIRGVERVYEEDQAPTLVDPSVELLISEYVSDIAIVVDGLLRYARCSSNVEGIPLGER
jgi:hypothetical protein